MKRLVKPPSPSQGNLMYKAKTFTVNSMTTTPSNNRMETFPYPSSLHDSVENDIIVKELTI